MGLLKLAFRNIWRQRGRTLLTLGVIVFGVVGLVLAGGFVADVFIQLREATIHSRLGHLQVYREGYASFGRRAPLDYLIEPSDELLSDLRQMPHVEDVMQRIEFSGLATAGGADLPIIGEGVEPDRESRLGTAIEITAGRQLGADDRYGVLIGLGVAQAMHLAPGDGLTLLVNTPHGGINTTDVTVIGVFKSISKDYDDRAVRLPLVTAQELLVTGGVHALVFRLDDTAATASVVARVKERLAGAGLEVHAWEELAGFYRKTVALYKRQFGVLQFITLVMVVLSVANSINMAVFERRGEIGTLMALGFRRRNIRRLVMLESVLLGACGAVAGVLIGIALAAAISLVGIPMPPPPNANSGYTAYIRIVPVTIGIAALVGFLATVLAAILPARRVSKLPVVDALRHNI